MKNVDFSNWHVINILITKCRKFLCFIVAGEYCSEESDDWRAEAKNCKYIHERMAYDTALGRCEEIGQTFSDYTKAKDMSGENLGKS